MLSDVDWLDEQIGLAPALEKNRGAMLSLLRRERKLSLVKANDVIEARVLRMQVVTADDLLRILQEETEKRRQATRILKWGILGAALLMFSIEFLLYFKNGHFDGWPMLSIAGLIGCVAAGAGSRLKVSVRAAALLRDPRSLWPLLEILNCGDAEVVATAKEALNQILRSEELQLDLAAQGRLGELLLSESDVEFVVSVLAALRSQGDSAAIPSMEQLAEGKGKVAKEEQERVRNLALMALADVRLRGARVIIEGAAPPMNVAEVQRITGNR